MSGSPAVYEVFVSDDAKIMLLEHASFLSNVSIEAAEKLIDTLEEAFDSLSQFPYRNAVYELNRVKGNYRRLVAGRYAVIYTVNEEAKTVKVCHILDTRMDNDF